jgi:hypothetical protein
VAEDEEEGDEEEEDGKRKVDGKAQEQEQAEKQAGGLWRMGMEARLLMDMDAEGLHMMGREMGLGLRIGLELGRAWRMRRIGLGLGLGLGRRNCNAEGGKCEGGDRDRDWEVRAAVVGACFVMGKQWREGEKEGKERGRKKEKENVVSCVRKRICAAPGHHGCVAHLHRQHTRAVLISHAHHGSRLGET